MKIGVIGCGAVGSYYGARLAQAGHPVHFLLRSDYETVRRDGVRILSVEGDFTVRPFAACEPAQIGGCEVVLVALKTTARAALPQLLPPLVTPTTRVVTLQNGLGNQEILTPWVAPERILGGLCFVCLNRIAPGLIRHTAHGRIVLGRWRGALTEADRDLAALLRQAGVPCDLTDNLERSHWEKLVWNIPFNGLGVAGVAGRDALERGWVPQVLPRGTTLPTDELLADPEWERWVRGLMAEVIEAARGLGHRIAPEYADEMVARTRCMGAYKASTLLDFEHGFPLELDSLFREPWQRARANGVATPRLAALCAILGELEARRSRGQLVTKDLR